MMHHRPIATITLRLGVFLLLTAFAMRILLPTLARMESNSFVIEMGNINMTSGEKSSSSYTITDTVGQTAPGEYSSAGYYVLSGFQYLYTIGTFSFSISNAAVDLGTLTPNTFATGSTVLTISAKGAGGYQVTAEESSPLKTIAGNTIADTTCDGGTCTETTAAIWTTPTNNGFGYNMTGTDIPTAFVSSSYFKQFANRTTFEPPQVVMSHPGYVKAHSATVTYKASIPGNQASGKYENSITYIATPGY